jgi:large subunit ribosomal protein L29
MARKNEIPPKELDDLALVDRLAAEKQSLFNLRFRHVTGQLDNHAEIRRTRREIARINTELRAREIAAAEAADEARDKETA